MKIIFIITVFIISIANFIYVRRSQNKYKFIISYGVLIACIGSNISYYIYFLISDTSEFSGIDKVSLVIFSVLFWVCLVLTLFELIEINTQRDIEHLLDSIKGLSLIGEFGLMPNSDNVAYSLRGYSNVKDVMTFFVYSCDSFKSIAKLLRFFLTHPKFHRDALELINSIYSKNNPFVSIRKITERNFYELNLDDLITYRKDEDKPFVPTAKLIDIWRNK